MKIILTYASIAETMLMSKKKADKQLNENITQRYRLWRDRLVKAVREFSSAKYTIKVSENLVGLFSLIFIKESEEKSLKDICVKKCKTGLGGYHGNKVNILMIWWGLYNPSICNDVF